MSHLNSEDALSMRKFYDQVVGHVRSVESMGEKFRSVTLAPVLVPLIVDKLPKKALEKWELEISDHKEDYVKVKTLFAFLEQLMRAKESSQPPSLQLKSPAQENMESWSPFQVQPFTKVLYLCLVHDNSRGYVHHLW